KYGEWRFDKRSYGTRPPPRNLESSKAGSMLVAGVVFLAEAAPNHASDGMKNELVRHLIHAINEATSVIPGWDDYAKTGVAKQLWDGVV
ncbi:hypothetical protein ABPG77_004053, partial [Micractinium sp. CCAP 211/92]